MMVPTLTHGQGVYVYDDHGHQYLDWTSQAVCANLGHTVPQAVLDATMHQLRTLPYTYGGVGVTEARIRLNQLINELLPGDLHAAVFPSSGAEANEAAIMAARRYTGRPKILSWYRSYHGATAGAAAATGDYRRWYHNHNGNNGGGLFVKAFNPFPLFFTHAGDSEAERVQSALGMLEEQILNEGPDSIASIVIEPIVGAGGCLIMPPGYMQGLRAICDKYGILLHVDEVRIHAGKICFRTCPTRKTLANIRSRSWLALAGPVTSLALKRTRMSSRTLSRLPRACPDHFCRSA
jgi:taurine---2-oxoglutarate transaminase